jgi:hypothetical protein
MCPRTMNLNALYKQFCPGIKIYSVARTIKPLLRYFFKVTHDNYLILN